MIMGSLAYLMTKMSYGYLTKYTHFQARSVVLLFHTDRKLPCLDV